MRGSVVDFATSSERVKAARARDRRALPVAEVRECRRRGRSALALASGDGWIVHLCRTPRPRTYRFEHGPIVRSVVVKDWPDVVALMQTLATGRSPDLTMQKLAEVPLIQPRRSLAVS